LKTQVENNTVDIPNCDHQIKLQNQSRIQRTDKNREGFQIYHTPTLLNGKIGNKGMKKVPSIETYKSSVTRNKKTQSNNDW
jgi:hypothetical protein